jgi:thiol-disulfide isomerase/thioredoxin
VTVRLLTVAAALIASGPLASAAEPPTEPGSPEKPPAIEVGKPAPSFMLKTLNPAQCGSEVVSTKAWVGSGAKEPRQAVVLSFAASWCKPCLKELPALKELEAKIREQGVAVTVIAIDKEDEQIEQIRKLVVEELVLPFPVGSDRYTIVQRRYGAENLPFLVLIDSEGVVRWFHSGYEADGLKPLEAELAKVLPTPAARPGQKKGKSG